MNLEPTDLLLAELVEAAAKHCLVWHGDPNEIEFPAHKTGLDCDTTLTPSSHQDEPVWELRCSPNIGIYPTDDPQILHLLDLITPTKTTKDTA